MHSIVCSAECFIRPAVFDQIHKSAESVVSCSMILDTFWFHLTNIVHFCTCNASVSERNVQKVIFSGYTKLSGSNPPVVKFYLPAVQHFTHMLQSGQQILSVYLDHACGFVLALFLVPTSSNSHENLSHSDVFHLS